MKRIMCALAVAMLAIGQLMGEAVQGDWSGWFFTTGPDKYSDGTTVRDGEYYAIVWRDASKEFGGFREGAELSGIVSGKTDLLVDTTSAQLISALPRAADGYMPDLYYTFPSKDFDKTYAKPTFSIYLLDTRRFGDPTYSYDENGNVTVTTNVLAGTGTVQGYAEVAGYLYVAGRVGEEVEGTTDGKSYLLSTLDNKAIPVPVISNMKIEDDYVVLTVKSTVSTIAYNAVAAKNVADVKAQSGTRAIAPVSGSQTQEGEITIRIRRDKTAQSEFYSIIRNPMK